MTAATPEKNREVSTGGRAPRGRSVAQVGGVMGSRVAHALELLKTRGILGGGVSRKVSARLDQGLVDAARAKMGPATDTELLTAALAIMAGDDEFGAWLVTRGDRLPQDFQLEF
jgi:hypothetical protein